MKNRKFRIVKKDTTTGDEVEEIGWADRKDLAQERARIEALGSFEFIEIQKFECTAVTDQIFEYQK